MLIKWFISTFPQIGDQLKTFHPILVSAEPKDPNQLQAYVNNLLFVPELLLT